MSNKIYYYILVTITYTGGDMRMADFDTYVDYCNYTYVVMYLVIRNTNRFLGWRVFEVVGDQPTYNTHTDFMRKNKNVKPKIQAFPFRIDLASQRIHTHVQNE
jgi:hypothetical protein